MGRGEREAGIIASMTTRMPMTCPTFAVTLCSAAAALACPQPQQTNGPTSAQPESTAAWRDTEQGVLDDHVQLTFPDRFVKAGEAYFSPDDSKIIFQAVEVPPAGEKPDEFYAMFVADVVRGASGSITGIDNIVRISPEGSANTCGWFHPTQPGIVMFGSTIIEPSEESPEFQREQGKYKWAFPPEMRIVQCDLREEDGTADTLTVLVGDGTAYCAEGSWSDDGRHILYCSRRSGEGDIYVLDTQTGESTCIVSAAGYDGGPFFSPDGRRICYRSDRRGDDKLQLFVADLTYDKEGAITGIAREYQLTDDGNVNWCPFWTRDGRSLVYSTSALGHSNYEIFQCDADPGDLSDAGGPIKYGTAKRRITSGPKADVLPAFSHDGKWMMWTSQRHDRETSQVWAARFVLDDPRPATERIENMPELTDNTFHVQDPETGLFYIYNRQTHELRAYDMRTHESRPVTDPAEIEKASRLFGRGEPD